MTDVQVDIVTVTHNDRNETLALKLREDIARFEDEGRYHFHEHSNREDNLGFAKGCNRGAFREGAEAPIIGFLNPDLIVSGPFLDVVLAEFADPAVVIVGSSFNKPRSHIDQWGLTNWVCGAAFFVRRDWFTEVGGFDEQFVWAWEETDLCHQAESQGKVVRSIPLPNLSHSSPTNDSIKDSKYKQKHFNRGAKRYWEKWNLHG